MNRQRPFGIRDSWAQPLVADGPSGRPRFQRWEYQLAVPCICLALGVRNGLQVPLLHRRERRIRDELRGLLPDLLPTIPAHPCHPDPITWTSVQPIRITDPDLTVAFLSPGQGPPAGVLRVARTPLAACELRAHHEALTELSGDPRLAGWHHLLPDALLFREDGGPPLAVDAYRPATDLARVLTRSPHRFEAALGAALAAISPLHQHTGQITVVNHTHLEQWVDRPLEELRRMCQTLAPVHLATVEHLGVLLHQALAGQRVAVSWTHGDFTPANVLFDGVQVSGIVDWGGARRDRPAVIDGYLMLITARCQVERRPLGPIVVRLLRAGGLGQREHDLLEQFWVFRDRAIGRELLPQRALILLTWLHHLAELSRRYERIREHRIWWMLNAEPVLQAITTLPPDPEVASP